MSNRVIAWLIAVTVLCSVVMSAAIMRPYRGKCSIRDEDAHKVLYRIHRGPLQELPSVVNDLRELATEKGIKTGEGFTLVALNNPQQEKVKHILTEIRIPVKGDIVPHAGKLGEMTDVKWVPKCRMAVVERPEDEAEVFLIYEEIRQYVGERGKVAIYGPQETISGDRHPDSYESEVKMIIWERNRLLPGSN